MKNQNARINLLLQYTAGFAIISCEFYGATKILQKHVLHIYTTLKVVQQHNKPPNALQGGEDYQQRLRSPILSIEGAESSKNLDFLNIERHQRI